MFNLNKVPGWFWAVLVALVVIMVFNRVSEGEESEPVFADDDDMQVGDDVDGEEEEEIDSDEEGEDEALDDAEDSDEEEDSEDGLDEEEQESME